MVVEPNAHRNGETSRTLAKPQIIVDFSAATHQFDACDRLEAPVAVGAGVSGVLIGRRANPAAASLPSTIHDLSTREIEVIRLVADGRSNKWIGEQLSLSALTVKSHLARIGRKLGTGDRAHMVALAMRAGVIS